MSAETVMHTRRSGGAAVWRAVRRPFRTIRGLWLLIIPLVLWQVLGNPEDFTFPTPKTWYTAVAELNSEGLLVPAIMRTLLTFVLSLIVATVLGVAIGIAVGASHRLGRALTGPLDFARAVPGVALVPALGLLFGNGLGSSVLIVVIAIIWPILLNAVLGMRSISPVLLDMARTLGLSRRERAFKVILPSLAPQVMMGVRISVSLSLIVTLVTDIIGTGEGLGRVLIDQQNLYQAPSVWGLLFLIGAFGFLVNVGFGVFEKLVFSRWPEDARPAG